MPEWNPCERASSILGHAIGCFAQNIVIVLPAKQVTRHIRNLAGFSYHHRSLRPCLCNANESVIVVCVDGPLKASFALVSIRCHAMPFSSARAYNMSQPERFAPATFGTRSPLPSLSSEQSHGTAQAQGPRCFSISFRWADRPSASENKSLRLGKHRRVVLLQEPASHFPRPGGTHAPTATRQDMRSGQD